VSDPSPPAGDAPLSPEVDRLVHEPATTCLNCGATLPGAFCPACGQKAQAARQPVGTLLRESFTEMFGLDGRFWRSVGALLVRPGHLTREYVAGRRMRYLRPLRLYLTATLAFFFLLSVLDPAARLERQLAGSADANVLVVPAARLPVLDSLLAAPPDSVEVSFDGDSTVAGWEVNVAEAVETGVSRERRRLTVERQILRGMPPDSAVSAVALDQAVGALAGRGEGDFGFEGRAWARGGLGEIANATNRADQARATATFLRAAIGRVPTVMFILLPLFALLLKLLYVRRDWYYAEHVVFALHTHAFAFVVFSLALGVVVAPGALASALRVVASVALPAIPLYFVLAMKRVYGQTWGKTLVKAGALGGAYLVLLALGLVGAAALAALT